jgi:uncharacterized protein YdeI (YjbR/CyaY-like superfamily)
MKHSVDAMNLLYVADRSAWRDWLMQHYRSETEVWLVYPKQHTGKPRIVYNDAVEEALCFGWIDSIVRRIDADTTAQRFSVRNPRSSYSQANKERLRALIEQGRVVPDVLAAVADLDLHHFEIPPDILAPIQSNPQAWANFQAFSDSYIRIRIAFIDAARKRPHEFEKRLRHFIKMTEQNKQFGFGGIEKYY